MSNITLGTNATTTLTKGVVLPSQAIGTLVHFGPADIAALNAAIREDVSNKQYLVPKPALINGILHIPGRGFLKLQPGDYIAVDAVGWPILVSGYSIANSGGWTHT